MRLQLRRLRPGDLDHELIWLSVTVLSAAAIAGWFALQLPWPRCTFQAICGIPCLTCGSTRAALAFLQADFLSAWRLNPLAMLTFCGIAAFDFYAIAVLISAAPRVRIGPLARTIRRKTALLFISAVLLNWVYLLRAN